MGYTPPYKQWLTIQEQANELPLRLREFYETRQIDRLIIDGNEIQGYAEYSFLDEKSYFEEPVRSATGVIDNLPSYQSFLTPHIVIRYDYMHISDYRKMMLLLNSKNEVTVTCYDIVLDDMVTHKMYFAPSSMPKLHTMYLEPLGVLDYTIELIGTNQDVPQYTITYNYNVPQFAMPNWDVGTSDFVEVTAYKNVSQIIGGENTQFSINGTYYNLSYEGTDSNGNEIRAINGYTFQGWNTKEDGTGFTYIDGDQYFIGHDLTLFAIWR